MRTYQRIGFTICIFFLAVLNSGLTSSPAHAQNRASSDYQITVTQSSDTSIYGDFSTRFMITLVHPIGFSLGLNQWFLVVDNVMVDVFIYSLNPTTDKFSYGDANLTDGSHFTPGEHTIKSTYQAPGSSIVISSNVITHTVQKATPDLICNISAENSLTFSPGHQLQLQMGLASVNGINTDYIGGTYTIIFSNGNATVTDANLTPQPGPILHVAVPTTPGQYELICVFNGSSLLNPAQKDWGHITVSAQNPVSNIQMYSSSDHLAPNQQITLYVILHGSSGLPPPTGIIALSIGGSYHTGAITLSGSGDATFQTTLPDLISSSDSLGIYYYGDSNYSVKSVNFPPPFALLPSQTSTPQPVTISTPTKTPLPTSGAPTQTPLPNSGNGQPPVATITTTTESTPTAADSATATPGALANAPSSLPPTSTSNHVARNADAPMWLIPILALLVLGGSGGAYLYFRRRRVPQVMTVATSAPEDIEHGVNFSNDQLP